MRKIVLFLTVSCLMVGCTENRKVNSLSIEPIIWCDYEPSSEDVTLFSETNLDFNSWNHISDSLKHSYGLSNSNFDVSASDWEEECQSQKSVLDLTLVKKIGDWNQQHLNGLEIFPGNKDLKLSNIGFLNLTIKINSEQSKIPSMKTIKEAFGHIANDSILTNLETSKFDLGLTLFDSGEIYPGTSSFNAFYNLELSESNFDHWLEISIPLSLFNTYLEENYNETSVRLTEYPEAILKGLRICAETHSTKVIRNFNQDIYQSQTPEELCKELSFLIGHISVSNH